MSYELENIQCSQKIFYCLLANGKLSEEDEPALYHSYLEEEEVINLVKSQAEVSDCIVERYRNTIYLIPNMTNNMLGFSKAELKKELCRSNGTNKDYYLSQFIILTLLVEFYDGQGSHCKARDFIKMGELQNIVAERLQEGVRAQEQSDEDMGLDFASMSQAFDALKSSDKPSRAMTTKEGMLFTVLNFLEKQDLIIFIREDEMIKTTERLDRLMEMKILNKTNYEQVMKAMGVELDE